jgi:homopolymeric O-antigen transport system permease protein
MKQNKSAILIIEPGRIEKDYWQDLWRYRELFYFLAWKDILVRYKQTFIGLAWALVRPFLTMIIFTIIFGYLAKLPSNGIPYPIMVFTALLPWQFFSTSFSGASNSLIANSHMVSKVYFPRLILPTSAVIVNFVDFAISFTILAAMMVWYDFTPSVTILFLPIFIIIAFAASLGASLWVSALNVKYRDFRLIIPFAVQMGLYISPVGYSSNIVPEKWLLLYSLNPMVGVIEGFRWAILGNDFQLYWPGFLLSLIIVLLLFISGLLFFRNEEKRFADII